MLRKLLLTTTKSLRGQVISLVSLAVFVTLVIFSLSVFFFVNRTEGVAWQGRQSEAAYSAAGTVSGFIQRVQDALTVVSIVEPDHLVTDPNELNALLKENPALLEIVRIDSSGLVFAHASRDKSVLSNLITIPQSQWFLQARQGQTYIGNVQLSANNKPYLIMAVPSADGGVVAARVEMGVLWDVVKNIRFGSSGEVIVITRAGDIIAHTNPEFAVSRQTLFGRPELSAILNAPNNEWSGSYVGFHNESVVAASVQASGTDWIVITELSQSEAFTNSRNAILTLGIEALILLVGVILVMTRFVHTLIANPMKQLQAGAAQIGRGDLNHRIGMTRADEIGQLSAAFDKMAVNLQQQHEKLTKQTTSLLTSEASLRRLTNQQEKFIEIAHELISSLELEAVFTKITASSIDILESASSALYLLEADGRTLRAAVVVDEECKDEIMSTPLDIDASFSGQAIKARRGLIFNDTADNEDGFQIPGTPENETEFIIAVPLIANETVLGVMCVSRYHKAFEESDLITAEVFATYATTALLNSRAHTQLQIEIQEREKAEDALRKREVSLRRITDNMFDVITEIGVDGTVVYASSSLKWVLGIEPGELTDEMIFERIHPDDMAEALKIFSQAVMDKTRPKPFSMRYQHANGAYLWMECAANILTSPQGEFAGAVLSSRDISERKKMETELSASEQRYRLLAENASDVIWTTDMTLQLNYVSPAAEKLFGYSVEETLARNIFQGMTPESAEYALSFFAQIMTELETGPVEPLRGASRVLELEWIRKDGSRFWAEVNLSFLLDEQDSATGILGITRDITERKLAENSRQKAIQYEYEAQRARELDILLKASEATSSSLNLGTVLLTLGSQLLEISGFQSCYISEWDKETNLVYGRAEHTRTFWREDLQDSYSMDDYPRSKEVLLTGNPVILQGDFESEEKQWMDELGRTALILLALKAREKTIGLVEICMTNKNKLFAPQVLQVCQEILTNAAASLIEPISANAPLKLYEIEEALIKASGGEICSFSEWDQARNCIHSYAVYADVFWESGQGPATSIEQYSSWKVALEQGQTSIFVRPDGNGRIANVFDGTSQLNIESLIIFPLQKGDERLGLIELYDFNYQTRVTPEQTALLRTIADKASYSIENARLLGQTQKRLDEQIALLNEKEVLLKEIHHRVKNNLQIISSLLNLQTDTVKDTGTLRALRDSQARVRSMALIHEKLYQSKSLAKIEFGEYVHNLANDLFRSYQRVLGDIQLKVQVDEVLLDLDYAVPCGLILNELMTNALKYAFPGRRKGVLQVELRVSPDHTVSLRVADDGVGLPAGMDVSKNKSLGLQLINSLAAQIDGKLEVESSAGTSFLVSFKH